MNIQDPLNDKVVSHAHGRLADLFNSVIAGREASAAMARALESDWLPAMETLLARTDGEALFGMQVRRLLVRLGWLLNALPQATSIHASVLDRAIREYRADWSVLSLQLFPEVKTRLVQADLLESELLDSLHVTVTGHAYRPRVPRAPIAAIAGVPAIRRAAPEGLSHALFSAARR